MVSATQKIWEAVANLDRGDTHTAALCHAIINIMVERGVVTREDANRQIEKSILKVVSVHKQIADAMQDMDTGIGAHPKSKTMQ
jgi:hypothetical protein